MTYAQIPKEKPNTFNLLPASQPIAVIHPSSHQPGLASERPFAAFSTYAATCHITTRLATH
jgi:hypothetical protein